jgi:hypothetical protein
VLDDRVDRSPDSAVIAPTSSTVRSIWVVASSIASPASAGAASGSETNGAYPFTTETAFSTSSRSIRLSTTPLFACRLISRR